MTLLSVNVNKIALLRNSRGSQEPSVTRAAQTAVDAGAHGITIHPRPDERHIRYQDARDLKAILDVELNIEGNPTRPFLDLVREVRPAQCTLVPDDPGQLTSDHGWDIDKHADSLSEIVEELHAKEIRVSLFMDPVPEEMIRAAATGADRVELYTEEYAQTHAAGTHAQCVDRYAECARAAQKENLGVNAGHDLNQKNLGDFIRAVPAVQEVSIGHALIGEALYDGLTPTVQRYVAILEDAVD